MPTTSWAIRIPKSCLDFICDIGSTQQVPPLGLGFRYSLRHSDCIISVLPTSLVDPVVVGSPSMETQRNRSIARREPYHHQAMSVPASGPAPLVKARSQDEPVPWDRTVETVWVKAPSAGSYQEIADELAFQENRLRLAAERVGPCSHPPLGDEAGAKSFGTGTGQGRSSQTEVNDTPGSHVQHRLHNRKTRYFMLPDRVRFMITRRVLEHQRP